MRGVASGMWMALVEIAVGLLAARMISERVQQAVAAIAALLRW